MSSSNIAIIGGGSLGTALAVNLSKKHGVNLYLRSVEDASKTALSRQNDHYLPGFKLADNVVVTSDLSEAVRGVDMILIATPVSAFESILAAVEPLRAKAPVIWGCKGCCRESGAPLSEIAAKLLGKDAIFGVLSGPGFSEGLAAGDPTALVVATNTNRKETLKIASSLSNNSLRVYANNDLEGVQICGAIKNVYAIAAGIIEGCGWGPNTRAAMMARAVSEIKLYLGKHKVKKSTLMGLSGFGDIYLTCGSKQSRNYQVGLALAEGKTLDEVLSQLGHVAEGVSTTRFILKRAESFGLEMPIVTAVHSILEGSHTPQQCATALMAREIKHEIRGLERKTSV